jgi:hypothetical protein
MPSLDLRFAETKSLTDWISGQDLITFTRASSGTVVNAAGTLETVASNLPRLTHNPLTGESLGLLLEGQRTNLLLNSATLSTQNVTVTAVAHTLSFTGTGTVTLSGVSTAGPLVGTGAGEANRVSLTFTPTAGTLTLTVSGTVTDAQLEAGSSRTSYIPTAGATATRSTDLASITGANFSSWYNQSEGTISLSGITLAANSGFLTLGDGSIADYVRLSRGFGLLNFLVSTASGTQVDLYTNGSSLALGQSFRSASCYRENDFAACLNGAGLATDVSGSLPPTANRMNIGFGLYIGELNGTIRRLTYWPQRLPNNSLVAITR